MADDYTCSGSCSRIVSNDQHMFKFVCNIEDCGKQFRRQDRLLIHLRTHTGEKPFECEEPGCDKSYSRQSHLKRHHQNAHGPLSEQKRTLFVCEEDGCRRSFTQEHNLQKHFRRQHSLEALHKYKCEVEGCKETFRKHNQLRAHSYTHTSVNPYQCSHPGCMRTFQTTTRLRRHNKVHQGYQCDKEGCNVSFTKWTELRQHMSKDHLEEYACEKCSKTFPKRHLLNNHCRSHHEEKCPLPCPYDDCDRMYQDKRNLKAHIRRYHEQERFPCDQPGCEKTFAFKQTLNEHLKTHSPDYSPPVKPCKVKHSKARKPGRRKKSAASKLSGICDMEMPMDFDQVIVENQDPNCSKTLTPHLDHREAENCNRAQQSDSQCGKVIMQTDWGSVLKLLEPPATCVRVSSVFNSSVPSTDCKISGDGTSDEIMEFGVSTSSSKCLVSDSMSEMYVSQSQKIITAPQVVFDSELGSNTPGCVTLTAL